MIKIEIKLTTGEKEIACISNANSLSEALEWMMSGIEIGTMLFGFEGVNGDKFYIFSHSIVGFRELKE